MAAFFGGDLALERHSDESYIADDVEDLVTDELVVEPERSFVEHAVGREHDGVVERSAEGEVCFPQHLDLMSEAEGARGGDLFAERSVIHHEVKRLSFDEGMREVDDAFDLEPVGRLDGHPAAVLIHVHPLQYF